MSDVKPIIPLEKITEIKDLLEVGMIEEANQIILNSAKPNHTEVFQTVGTLTREVHDALIRFSNDIRIQQIAAIEIADARGRLNHVINLTESAANRTMDNVDNISSHVSRMSDTITAIHPEWKSLMRTDIDLDDFKQLCRKVDTFLDETKEETENCQEKLNDIVMAQEFQDLSGQIISKAISLTTEVEDSLVELLRLFKIDLDTRRDEHESEELEGPIHDADERDDVVGGQDEVDDLLSSLGF